MKGYIYKIVNKENGKFYIGSTIEPQKRQKRHFDDLKNKKHHCLFLQRAYDKYGVDRFEFLPREVNVTDDKELRLLEERYIGYCWNSGKLYNTSKKGSGGDLMCGEGNPNYGNHWTYEMRKKMSDYWKKYYSEHECMLKGKTYEEIHGEEKAKELKEKISERCKLRVGEKNSFYGKHHSLESKEKMRKAKLGKKPVNSKKVSYNNTIYESANDCAKQLGIPMVTVAYRCRKEIYGFKYEN